jgi:exodeoxyribonuclease-5
MEYSFLGDQKFAFEQAMTFFDNAGGGISLLCGEAGTGKSKVVSFMISELLNRGRKSIVVAAPTGQAVKVNQNNSNHDERVTFATLHKTFGLRAVKDSDELRFVRDYKKPCIADSADIFIIDEVSQLEDFIFYYLVHEVEKGKHVLLVGDDGQTPPINNNYAMPFLPTYQEQYGISVIDMFKPIRQAEGNPILDIAVEVNTKRKYRIPIFKRKSCVNPLGEGVEFMNVASDEVIDKVHDLVENEFLSENFINNPDYFKVIAWRNKTVDYWNRVVRKKVYSFAKGDSEYYDDKGRLRKMVPNEMVLAGGPEFEWVGDEQRMIYGTNTELHVKSSSVKIMDNIPVAGVELNTTSLKYYDVMVEFENTQGVYTSHNINVIHEDSEKAYLKLLGDLADYAKEGSTYQKYSGWKDFWLAKEMFAAIRHNYARTVHTAQGSTFQNGVVMEWDILENPKIQERNRVLYTAITRFSNKVYIAYEK